MNRSHIETVFVLNQHLDYYSLCLSATHLPVARQKISIQMEFVQPVCDIRKSMKIAACKQCNELIIIYSKALECDKCSSWCHIACTNVPEALYDFLFLVCNKLEDGIKWFCHDCRVGSVDSHESTTPDINLNNSGDTTAAVCNKLKLGTCPHGITGKTLVNGKKCDFAHPKLCKKYTKNGLHGKFGCNGFGCDLLHPMLCNDSVRNRKCHNPNCKLYHLRWTERDTNRKPRGGQSNYRQNGNNSPGNQYPDNNADYRRTTNSQGHKSRWVNQLNSWQANNPKDF